MTSQWRFRYELMLQCWAMDRNCRPSFVGLQDCFEKLCAGNVDNVRHTIFIVVCSVVGYMQCTNCHVAT